MFIRWFSEPNGNTSPDEVLNNSQNLVDRNLNWVASKLRKYPTWLDGHIYFAEQSLSLGNLIASYGAIQCAKALLKNLDDNQKRNHVERLLAKVYLGMGQPGETQKILNQLKEKEELSISDREDLAAALMAQGNKEEAKKILQELETSAVGGRTSGVVRYLSQDNS